MQDCHQRHDTVMLLWCMVRFAAFSCTDKCCGLIVNVCWLVDCDGFIEQISLCTALGDTMVATEMISTSSTSVRSAINLLMMPWKITVCQH